MTSAVETGGSSEWNQTYSYDQWGNRAVSGNYIPNAYATPSALAQYSNNQWLGPSAAYDGAGNQTSLPSRTFTYDAENRVIASTQPMMGTIQYAYDGSGRRVQKTVGTTNTVLVYDGMGQLTAEYGPSSTSGTQYVVSDMLGSTRLLFSTTGVVERFDYLPFGEELTAGVGGRTTAQDYSTILYPSATPDLQDVKFTAKERDAETGLDFFGARYFSSAQGRFTSPDWSATPQPIPYADLSNPQSLNLYNYMRNNPLSGTDPDGHCCDWNDVKQFGSGFADTTYRPIVQAVSHPLDTLGALGNAALHPLDTAGAIKDAVVNTASSALSGDPNALGQVTGTVVSALATAGVGKAASALVQGAEVGEVAATTSLFRAVGSAEAESIGGKAAFTAAPNGTEFKGFFLNQSDAQSFGTRMTQMTGDTHTVVQGEAPTGLVNASPVHNAATEGRGVLINNQNLPQVKVKLPNQP